MSTIFSILVATFLSVSAFAKEVDCSEAYGDENNRCEQIKCDEKYQSFLGTWSGPMESLIDFGPNPVYRKYLNTISYSPLDCLKNLDNGDTFIIGRQTDLFPATGNMPAKTEAKLLITGKDAKQQPFLRTVDLSTKKKESWQLVHKNDVAVLSIWQIQGTQNGAPYTVETIDAQDWTVSHPTVEHRRNVTVTLKSGDFTRVLVRGYHTKK